MVTQLFSSTPLYKASRCPLAHCFMSCTFTVLATVSLHHDHIQPQGLDIDSNKSFENHSGQHLTSIKQEGHKVVKYCK